MNRMAGASRDLERCPGYISLAHSNEGLNTAVYEPDQQN